MKVLKISAVTVFMLVYGVLMVNKIQASPSCNFTIWNNVNKVQVWNNVNKVEASPDCQTNIWNNFLAANDSYTSAFGTFYANFYQTPAPCTASCEQSCSNTTGTAHDTCVASCFYNCRNAAQTAYYNAQDGLSNAASQSCQAQLRLACSEIQQRLDTCDTEYYNVLEETDDFQIQQSAYFVWSSCYLVNQQIPCDN